MPTAANRLVLVLRDARLAVDDEVALPRCSLVPAVERHLKAVTERSGDTLHPRARQDRAVNRDRLPALKPLRQRRHALSLGPLRSHGRLISIQGYSAWIQLTRSSRLTVSSRVG